MAGEKIRLRQFATAWTTENITYEDEPMQVLVFLLVHDRGIDIVHYTCRSLGVAVYGYYKEEFGFDDRDVALEYWKGVKTGDEAIRDTIHQRFADQLGFGVPF